MLADEQSIATLNISLGWTTLEFRLPIEIVSYLITLLAELRQTTINFSFSSCSKIGIKVLAISSGEVIFLFENSFCWDCTLLPNSNAASKVAALSFPIPDSLVKDSKVRDAILERPPSSFTIFCAMLNTDLPFVPVRSNIANSSASLRFWEPCNTNFSRGLSSAGNSFTPMILTPNSCYI